MRDKNVATGKLPLDIRMMVLAIARLLPRDAAPLFVRDVLPRLASIYAPCYGPTVRCLLAKLARWVREKLLGARSEPAGARDPRDHECCCWFPFALFLSAGHAERSHQIEALEREVLRAVEEALRRAAGAVSPQAGHASSKC